MGKRVILGIGGDAGVEGVVGRVIGLIRGIGINIAFDICGIERKIDRKMKIIKIDT